MFLRREFSECNSEVFSGVVFVPFGWPFSLPFISVSRRNPSRVLKYFCLSNRLCFCCGMCLAMRFLSLRFDIFRSCFIAACVGYCAYIFTVRFLHRNCVAFGDFFAVTSTLKGNECLQTRCLSDAKKQFFAC